ncbi:hypothetical protein ME7_00475 [Bartonella birtlesii LL-WM9]|uniref:Uncharacterized protein n=1 Tax=Bartonella birtlesii LL-WM9 TaxID=1094552 RepID=J0PY41_9HYPH|nr:hypothetical protein ME7_00475 [Bartonella birtlesii LL-WM9]
MNVRFALMIMNIIIKKLIILPGMRILSIGEKEIFY